MRSQKMKTIFVVVCLIIIAATIISLLPSGKKDAVGTAKEAETVSTEPAAEIETTEPTNDPEPESESAKKIEHRSGDEIIGISEKDISDLHLVYYESVIDDVTGKWRLSVMSEDIDIQDYIYSYYNNYFKDDTEIHGIVNLSSNTTARINCTAGMLFVNEYSYVDGEEHDAKLLYSGTPIKSYIVYTDNGDIEKSEERRQGDLWGKY